MTWTTIAFLIAAMPSAVELNSLQLEPGDHICIIGNALAERMQHYGWLETLIHARFPQHELVFRNLGYSGDEVGGFTDKPDFNKRLRSMDYGSADQWLAGSAPVPQPGKLSKRDDGKVRQNRFELTNTKADVIFAFFGYNESWAGEAGLPKFKADLEAFIRHTLSQKYNGKSAPKLVMFSPIAMEWMNDPNLPSKEEVAAINSRIKKYADAIAEVAKANGIKFVDLIEPTIGFGAEAPNGEGRPITINGIHVNLEGDMWLAAYSMDQLIEAEWGEGEWWKTLEPLRRAVNDKNFYWYNRYRVTDGYSTYGERAFLKFAEGPGGYGEGLSNYSVGQRELEVLDVLTANRDKVVWAAAQGKELKPDDSKLPEYIPVISNKPGPLPGGKHEFLSGEAAIEKMTVHKNMKVELFADESMFPELVNPVQMAFDTKGRLWVAAWHTYPHWKPTEKMDDKLLILEDTDGDGKADVCKTFAGDLHNPTGFEFWGGGVIVAQGPDILFLKDTDGDDRYDVKERILHGLDTADTHHTSNSFVLDPGGALYFQEGTFHHTQVETPWGPPVRCANAGVYRYEPRTRKFDVYVTFGFANPHGHAFDRWGQDFVFDGTGANPFHGPLFSSHLDYPNKHNRPPQVYLQRTRPCPGVEVLSSSHFPEEFRGHLLVGNVIGFQGILQYKLEDKDSSFGATELEPIVYSSDLDIRTKDNFRPSDLEVAPDGSLYFTDWQNPIIGHMQHNLRDPSRDREHGRVYRVTYEGRPLVKPAPIAGQPIEKLLWLLTSPDDRVRYRARIELSGRPTDEVIAAAEKWAQDASDPNTWDKREPWHDSEAEHALLEALWLHQSHNVVDPQLLERVLTCRNPKARAAALRVLAAWQDRVPNTLSLLLRAATDDASRVRLMAIWATSFVPQAEAAEVVLVANEYPTDEYIDFLSKEVMRTFQPQLDKAKADGRRVAFRTEAGARYYLKGLTNDQLLQEKRDRLVLTEMLFRPGLRDEQRHEAVQGLARLDEKSELRVIMDGITSLDGKQSSVDPVVVFDVVRQLTGRSSRELASARAELEKLATSAKQPVFRQIGFVSLINVDGNPDKAWALAESDAKRLQDFLAAMPLISDAGVRASLYQRVEPLLHGLPEPLAAKTGGGKGTMGRFVHVELPAKGTLTLAEVEVMSGGQNIARRGRASQKNTAHGGDASRAIDGNKSGSFGQGGQTHSEENTGNPWWEVDLGEEYPLDQIVIYNRMDGDLGQRLNNFTLKVLDSKRGELFKQERIPAPKVSAAFDLEGGGPAALVRRAAMNALTHARGQEAKTFATLAKFVKEDNDRVQAVRALQRLPRATWPKEEAPPLLAVLMDHVKKTPAAERTSPAALDVLEFADALTTLLPPDLAKKTRRDLDELGVRVIKIGTVFERMSYDKDVIVVQAGRPVEFLLENGDLMPHNFAITRPGALEEIGLLAEANAQQPGFAEKHYVPDSPKILLKSTLLQPRESQKLSFVAPKELGVYPYVCTYPGHWRRMYGALYVVEDLDDYRADPESYLAEHKIEAKDALLKDRRPRTEWKFEDLAAAVEQLGKDNSHGGASDIGHAPPSYNTAKHLFQVANCFACHRLDGVGNEFGPDLTKLDAKLTPTDILRDILEPSSKINEKYQSYVFETESGKILTGIILEETPKAVKIIENPLANPTPVTLKPSEIAARQKSPTSIMPKGLLDQLTRDEILDLIAYVAARGDQNHAFFHGGHEHGSTR